MKPDPFKSYGPGTILFCDFLFSKPRARCVEVIEEGNGKARSGLIRVKLLESWGGYAKGEIITLSSIDAVPVKQKLPLLRGQYFTRISTLYRWVKSVDPVVAPQKPSLMKQIFGQYA